MQKNNLKYEFIAEFFGTFLFIILGIGCIANFKLIGTHYSQLEISVIWGIAVSISVYLTRGISGAHLNPSVTIALAIFRDFPKRKIIPYITAQMLGSFVASAIIYYIYFDLFLIKNLETASIFTTFPNSNISFFHAFMIEFFITFLLIFSIFSLCNTKNISISETTIPLFVGILITIISGVFGPLTGSSMNAARDFSPRLFIILAGWGSEVMTGNRELPYAFVPIFAPIIGGIAGGLFYNKLLIIK